MSLPLYDFFPFNKTVGESTTNKTDDGSSPPIITPSTRTIGDSLSKVNGFPLFNKSYRTLYVNNNGIISFKTKEDSYNPEDFPRNNSPPVIAPFWADIDIQNVGGSVFYLNSSDKDILNLASSEVRHYFPQYGNFNATWVLIATWYNVGFYSAKGWRKNKKNTFQAVLITNWVQSFAIFNYNKLEWTSSKTEDNTSTSPESEVQAGFDAGNGAAHYQIKGARSNHVESILHTSNVGKPGKWVFRIDLAEIQFEPCLNEKFSVTPRSGHMLGGQHLTISGPCFPRAKTFDAVFKEINKTFPCIVNNAITASCVTPGLSSTGDFTINFNLTPFTNAYEETFSVVNLAKTIPQVIRANPSQWIIGNDVFISWNASELASEKMYIDVLGLTISQNIIQWSSVQNMTESGVENITLTLKETLLDYNTAIVRVMAEIEHNSMSPLALWSDAFPVYQEERTSEEWCNKWLEAEPPLEVDVDPNNCPCILRQASRDTSRYENDPLCHTDSKDKPLNCFCHRQANNCVLLNLQSKSTAGQSCCYGGRNNSLLEWETSMDSGYVFRYNYRAQGPDIVPYLTHFEADILPHLHCCRYSRKAHLCKSFFKKRPASRCNAYKPPSPAQAAGDPHLVTLDGKRYTFNGVGEFVLMEDKNRTIVVQVKAEQARDIEGQLQNATIFTAIAMKVEDISKVVKVYMDSKTHYKLLLDDQEYHLPTLEMQGLSVTVNETNENSTDIMVVFSSVELSVQIEVTPDVLNILLMMGSKTLHNNVEGLLGNYNGNASDDFISREGIMLLPNSSMAEIHYQFGESWKVKPEERLFTSIPEPKDEDTYQPVFIDTLDESNLRNGTAELCGDVLPCKFDYQLIGKPSIALATKKFVTKFDALQKDIETVNLCPPIGYLENGNMTITGNLPGDYAIFQCDPNYIRLDSEKVTCLPNGTWDRTIPKCVKKVPTPQWHSWFAYGIGAILALICILAFVCSKCRRNLIQTVSKDDISLPPILQIEAISQPIFSNQHFLQSLQRLNEGGSFRIPRPTYIDPKIYEEYF